MTASIVKTPGELRKGARGRLLHEVYSRENQHLFPASTEVVVTRSVGAARVRYCEVKVNGRFAPMLLQEPLTLFSGPGLRGRRLGVQRLGRRGRVEMMTRAARPPEREDTVVIASSPNVVSVEAMPVEAVGSAVEPVLESVLDVPAVRPHGVREVGGVMGIHWQTPRSQWEPIVNDRPESVRIAWITADPHHPRETLALAEELATRLGHRGRYRRSAAIIGAAPRRLGMLIAAAAHRGIDSTGQSFECYVEANSMADQASSASPCPASSATLSVA